MFNPLVGARVLWVTTTITQDELRSRMRAQKQRHRDLQVQFNPETLLSQLVMPEMVSLPAAEPPRRGMIRRSMARAGLRLNRGTASAT